MGVQFGAFCCSVILTSCCFSCSTKMTKKYWDLAIFPFSHNLGHIIEVSPILFKRKIPVVQIGESRMPNRGNAANNIENTKWTFPAGIRESGLRMIIEEGNFCRFLDCPNFEDISRSAQFSNFCSEFFTRCFACTSIIYIYIYIYSTSQLFPHFHTI